MRRCGEFVLCSSRKTVDEFEEVCERPSVRLKLPSITSEAVGQVGELLTSGCCVRSAPPVAICRDLTDDKFIACALATGAEHIVTYDKDLLELDGYCGLCILTPEDFLLVLHDSESAEPRTEV